MKAGARICKVLLQLATAATIIFSGGIAAARQDEIELTTRKAPRPPAAAPERVHVEWGVAGTTDYMSRGITQTGNGPAIQGYIEPVYDTGPVFGDLFLNVWSSNVDFGSGLNGTEIDVAAGIRPKFLGPKWSPSFGFVYYFYTPEDINPDYGELYARTDYTFGRDDRFTVRGLVFFAPDYDQGGFTGTWVSAGGRVMLWKHLGAYAGIGYQFFGNENQVEQLAWVAGMSYVWKSLTFDIRYWDTNLNDAECLVTSGFLGGCDARVVGTISLDTTWSALFGTRR